MRKNLTRGAVLAALVLSLAACQDGVTDLTGPGTDVAAARGGVGGGNGNGGGNGGGGNGGGGNGGSAAKIAFAVAGSGLYAMAADGSGYAAVSNTLEGTDPAWSPDRKTLAYAVPSGTAAGIYVITPKGTKRVRLYAGPAGAPAWSPDGRRIAFHADVAGGKHVFVMNADGSNLQQATTLGTVNRDPDWSPDGTRIAFVTNRPYQAGIWVMNADGTDRRRIVDCHECTGPTWSPVIGAELIAYSFYSTGTIDHAGVRVVDSDGHVPVHAPDALVYSPAHGTRDLQPSWSPDGTRIVIASGMIGGGRELVAVDPAAQAAPVRLTTTSALEMAPAWAR